MLQHFYLKAKTPITLEDIQLSLVSINEDKDADNIELIELKTKKNDLQGRTPRQQSYLKLIQENDINFGIGPAGTGKTYLAVASAIDALNREKIKDYLGSTSSRGRRKIGISSRRPRAKVDPYLRPLYDALYDLGGYETVNKWFEKQIVEIAPLAYMRGRTLNQSFIILDEAQNTTPEQMKMFLTRIGFGTKAVITGDITQIDLTKGQKSGLLEIERVLKDIKGISFTKFQSKDVVRHPIVQKIIDAYDKMKMIRVHIQDVINKKNALTGPICKKIFSSVWKKEAEITVRITTASESQELNHHYRNQNKPTNILSFNIESNRSLIGDLVLCHDIVKKKQKNKIKK